MPLLDSLSLAATESNLLAARELMAFTLGFHIVLACIGVAFPALVLTANYIGLRRDDPDAMRLARRWSKAAGVTFAIGAVTGTVLSFEFGLLWPQFMERFGDAFGIAFAIEGIFFFTEAIFLAIYIYGWKRLSGWAHFWSGVPMLVAGIGGAFSVVTANAWMNQPQGFTLDAAGKVVGTDPLEVLFNPAWTYEVPHMILAAYMVAGFLFASVYAVGMLRGRRDRLHRLGLLIPLTIACIATPMQIFVGDMAAREVADHQPAKFAAFECIQETGPDQTEYLGGICTDDGVKGAIGIPGLDSWLVGFSTDTVVTGLNDIPDERAAAGQHAAAPLLRRDGRDRLRRCWRWPAGSPSSGGGGATSRARPGSCARSRSPAPRRSSPSGPAGSSPRSAASPGSCRATCAPRKRSPRPRASGSSSPRCCSSTRPWARRRSSSCARSRAAGARRTRKPATAKPPTAPRRSSTP